MEVAVAARMSPADVRALSADELFTLIEVLERRNG
jgi:hypothetical protein